MLQGSGGQFETGAGRDRGAEEKGRLRGHAPGGDALQEPRGTERGGGGGAEVLPRGAQGRRAVGAVQERGKFENMLGWLQFEHCFALDEINLFIPATTNSSKLDIINKAWYTI